MYRYGAHGRYKKIRSGKFLCNKCHHYKPKKEFFYRRNTISHITHACKKCFYGIAKLWREKNRGKVVLYTVQWTKNHPQAHEAHRLIKNALKNKSLKRKPCEKCGVVNSQAHHDDYSKPFRVKWLCPLHHSERHRRLAA